MVKRLLSASVRRIRRQLEASSADERGIALQTVIIMVVLIAIAGAVAAVLVTRGGEAVDEIRSTNIAQQPSNFTNETLCEAADFHWVNGACQAQAAPSPPPPPPSTTLALAAGACQSGGHHWDGGTSTCTVYADKSLYTTEANCEHADVGGTWTPDGDPTGSCA